MTTINQIKWTTYNWRERLWLSFIEQYTIRIHITNMIKQEKLERTSWKTNAMNKISENQHVNVVNKAHGMNRGEWLMQQN